MWTDFTKFFSLHLPPTDIARMRSVYAEALEAVGSSFASGQLWRSALAFETANNGRPFFLLAKAICYPIGELRTFWTDLQTLISKTLTSELAAFSPSLTLAELFEMPIEEQTFSDEQAARSEIIQKLTDRYNAALKSHCRRLKFEALITRTYFHFNSPDESQINNWEDYISMLQDSEASRHEIVELFERALIPCAFIDGIWFRYATYIETFSVEEARLVYQRIPYAVMPRLRVVYAEFEEEFSELGVYDRIYQELSESRLVEHVIAAANYKLRHDQTESAIALLTEARDRLADDPEGRAVVASVLLEVSGIESDDVHSGIYVIKRAKKVAESDPQAANTILFDAIFSDTQILIEDRVSILQTYLEYVRQWGFEASFQLDMELAFMNMKNKVVWHRDYFEHSFLTAGEPPEKRDQAWIEYQRHVDSFT
jgi:hypothetical protein